MALIVPHLLQWWQELCRTTPINPFLFFSLLLLSLLFLLKPIKGGSKLNLPPSPPGLLIIGYLCRLGMVPHRLLYALSKRYGPLFLLNLGRSSVLVVTSGKIAKEIMNTQDIVFSNRARTRAIETLLYGCCDVAYAPYGEHWRQMRRICVLQLLNPRRVRSFHFVREADAAKLIEKLRYASLDGASINLGEMFVHASRSIILSCVLGRMYEENTTRCEELLRTGSELVQGLCVGDIFPCFGWVDVLAGVVKRLKNTSKEMDVFLGELIEEYQRSNDDHPDKKSFIEILLQLHKEGILEMDIAHEKIKATLLDMLVGATDTTAATMEWAMTQLMKNPSKMKKTQEEVRRVVGMKSMVDQDDIDQMDYLQCVVKEILRLHPPLPFLVPRELAEHTKLEGYDIPPKTKVFINAWAIQRDPKSWDRPEEFLPERFTNNSLDFKGQAFHFIPFGAGRRSCPGISFGILEIEYVLANLLYWFDWKFPGGAGAKDLDMGEVYGLLARKKKPLQLVPVLHFPISQT